MAENELHEYEVTDHTGTVSTVQLTEEDAKAYPHARKTGKRVTAEQQTGQQQSTGKATPNTAAHQHDQVQNRARQQK